jgi:hypothetical protein
MYKKYTDENGTDIRKLPNNEFREQIKKILKDQEEPSAYHRLLKEFGTNINDNEAFLNSVIERA